jgi:hypothetical protein
MTLSDKAVYWQQHFKDWQQSGLSQRDYCQKHQLTFSSFGYWRKRLKTSQSTSSKLIPVSVSRPALITVYLPSGVRIEAPLHSLVELLPLLFSGASR